MDQTVRKLPTILQPTKDDIALMLAAECHLGSRNLDSQMKTYVFSRRVDGIHVLHQGKTWEKLILAARVLAITPPQDIYVASSTAKSRRPAIKLAQYLGAKSNQGRFIPGTFTNTLAEPALLVCMDPMTDYHAVLESSRCNMPVIAFTNTHSNLKYADIAIPCNNVGAQSIGVMAWLLARAVLRLGGILNYVDAWSVLPDMFFYSDEPTLPSGPRHPPQDSSSSAAVDNWDTADSGTQNNNAVNWTFEMTKEHGQGTDSWDVWHEPFVNQPVGSSRQPPTLIDWADDVPGQDPEEGQLPVEEGWGDIGNTRTSGGFNPSNNLWDN